MKELVLRSSRWLSRRMIRQGKEVFDERCSKSDGYGSSLEVHAPQRNCFSDCYTSFAKISSCQL